MPIADAIPSHRYELPDCSPVFFPFSGNKGKGNKCVN
jgi:hypothetical protein